MLSRQTGYKALLEATFLCGNDVMIRAMALVVEVPCQFKGQLGIFTLDQKKREILQKTGKKRGFKVATLKELSRALRKGLRPGRTCDMCLGVWWPKIDCMDQSSKRQTVGLEILLFWMCRPQTKVTLTMPRETFAASDFGSWWLKLRRRPLQWSVTI